MRKCMSKKNIVGANDSKELETINLDIDTAHKTNYDFWDTVGSELLGVTALPQYGAFLTEEKLHLLNNVQNTKILEIGCVSIENDKLLFTNSYFDESWYSTKIGDKKIMLSNRKLSTYINSLSKAGFVIDKLIEESDEDIIKSCSNYDFANKAKMLPVTFVIKCRKL